MWVFSVCSCIACQQLLSYTNEIVHCGGLRQRQAVHRLVETLPNLINIKCTTACLLIHSLTHLPVLPSGEHICKLPGSKLFKRYYCHALSKPRTSRYTCGEKSCSSQTMIMIIKRQQRFSFTILLSVLASKLDKEKQGNWTELTRFSFCELTNGQAGRAHWSLVKEYVSVVT